MKRILFFGFVFSFLVVGGVLFFGKGAFAATCSFSPSSIGSSGTRVATFSWDMTGDVTDPATVRPDISCSGVGVTVSSSDRTGKDSLTLPAFRSDESGTETCTVNRTQCSASLSVVKAQSATDTCTSNCGTGGTCRCEKDSGCTSPKTIVSAGNEYCAKQLTDGVCCKTPSSSSTCTGGGCKETCATGETEDTACSASQCASQAVNKKYCKTGGSGPGTTAVKCDPAKFKEYAGVCFPLNTGLSEMSVAKIVMNLMKWMLYLFGFLAIIAFVISGIQYLSAAGNMNMIETAKRNMTWSIVGVIVALAGLVIIIAIDALLRGTAWGG